MFGKGLLHGLCVTGRHFFGKKETVCYPEEKLPMTAAFRGGHLQLDTKQCIGCGLCAKSCPNTAIVVETRQDEQHKRHIDHYWHNLGRCMYCNLCCEACPLQILDWDQAYAQASWQKAAMQYDVAAESEERRREQWIRSWLM